MDDEFFIETIESNLGLTFDGDDLAAVHTVEDFADLVIEQVFDDVSEERRQRRNQRFARDKVAYYRLRQLLSSAMMQSKREIRPGTRIADLVALRMRPQLWIDLREAEFKPPALRMTIWGWMAWAIICMVGVEISRKFLFWSLGVNNPFIFVLILVLWSLMGIGILYIFGTRGVIPYVIGKIPQSAETVGSLVRCWRGTLPESVNVRDSESPADRTRKPVEDDATALCATAHAFYAVQNILVEVGGVSRKKVKRDAILEKLLPYSKRKQTWDRLRENWDFLPQLEFTESGCAYSVLAGIVASGIVFGGVTWLSSVITGGRWTLIVPAIVLGEFGFIFGCGKFVQMLEKFGNRGWAPSLSCGIPRRCSTVELLVLLIASGSTIRRAHDQPYRLSEREVREYIYHLLAVESGVKRELIQPETEIGTLFD